MEVAGDEGGFCGLLPVDQKAINMLRRQRLE